MYIRPKLNILLLNDVYGHFASVIYKSINTGLSIIYIYIYVGIIVPVVHSGL